MTFLVPLGEWLLQQLLAFLYGRASKAVDKAVAKRIEDEERGRINAQNIKAYDEAVNRAERISAALKLLNRSP